MSCKKDTDDIVTPSSNLTITILSVDRNVQNGVAISWKADAEKNVEQYQLERSSDSINFTSFSNVAASGNTGGSVNYSNNDPIFTTNTFYRIKGTVTGGIIKYSNIVKIGCDLKSGNVIGRYRITALRYKPDAASPEIDIYAGFDPCEKDDYILFNSNNTNTFQDAGIQCVPPGNDIGTWTFMAPNMIHLDGEVATVTTFNCTGMTFTFTGPVPGELTTIVLARQ